MIEIVDERGIVYNIFNFGGDYTLEASIGIEWDDCYHTITKDDYWEFGRLYGADQLEFVRIFDDRIDVYRAGVMDSTRDFIASFKLEKIDYDY